MSFEIINKSGRGNLNIWHSERESGLVGKVQEVQYVGVRNMELGCTGDRANEVGKDRSLTLAEEFGLLSESTEEPLISNKWIL